MNFRKLVLSLALLVAVGATFGFKKPQSGVPAAVLVGPICEQGAGLYTDQAECAPQGTGPQCTVTIGVTHYLAWETGTSSCSIPLYVFQ